jgi:hypothetical protein
MCLMRILFNAPVACLNRLCYCSWQGGQGLLVYIGSRNDQFSCTWEIGVNYTKGYTMSLDDRILEGSICQPCGAYEVIMLELRSISISMCIYYT